MSDPEKTESLVERWLREHQEGQGRRPTTGCLVDRRTGQIHVVSCPEVKRIPEEERTFFPNLGQVKTQGYHRYCRCAKPESPSG